MSQRAKHKKRIVSAVSARTGPTLLAAGGQISLEISGKSVTTGDRQGTAPPSMSRRPTTNPTPKHSAHHPVVVSKHESCADGISKGADLLLPKHELQEVGFPWKFPEISGNFRRSAVGRSAVVSGRRSAYLRRRSNFPGNFQKPGFFRGVKFPKEFLEIWT